MDFSIQAIVNLAFHVANGLLVFLLFKKITKRDILAFIAVGLFLINSHSQEVVAWPSENLGILLTAFLVLLSLILLVDYSRKPLLLLAVPTGLYFFMGKASSPMSGVLPPATYIFRVLAVPLKGISQAFFPERLMVKMAEMFTSVAYPQFSDRGVINPYVSQVIVFDLLAYLLTIAILIFSYYLYHYLKMHQEKRLGDALFFSLIFMIVSLLPFIFIPGDLGYFSVFKPENLYLASIGSSLISIIAIFSLMKIFQRKL